MALRSAPAQARTSRCRDARWVLLASLHLRASLAQHYYDACDGQYDNVADAVGIVGGQTVTRDIQNNSTHRWTYSNYNLTTIVQNDTERKLIIYLEPCYGIVYLFIRKNVPCHPDPYSCINLDTGDREVNKCRRTHFMSEINGTRDGAPTFFQISLSATQYYISIYAAEDSRYSLTVLDEVGAWPRRGNGGIVQGSVIGVNKVSLQWDIATYFPEGVATTLQYHVYAVRLVPNDTVANPAVFIRPQKVLNTFCGLQNNTDAPDDILPARLCDDVCNTTIDGLISGSTYAFNVVAESTRGFRMAYAGVTMVTKWDAKTSIGGVSVSSSIAGSGRRLLETASVPMDSRDMQVVGAVMGSVLGMVGMAGMVLLRFAS